MGAGHYVTTSEGTGRYYAEVASEMRRKVVQEGGYTYNGKVVRSRPLVDAYEALKKSEFDVDKAIESIEHRIAVIRRVKGDKANTTNAEEALRFLNEEKANKGILGYQEEIVEKPERHLYEVEIPDDNGKNYFDLDKKATKKTKDEAKKRLYSALSESEEAENWKKNRDIIEDEWRYNVNTSEATNDSVRATMEQFLTQEEVADILSDMGYVGSKSKATDGTTYIIYKDDNIEIKSNTRFRVSNDNQEIFVSNAQRAVEGIKQDKGTPQQWLAMIEKNGGLKAGEDKWLGLSDWLKGMGKKSVTKDEILDFIGENKIRIEEVTYGEEAGGYSEEKLDEFNAEYEELIWEGEEETGSIYANDWADYAYEAMVARYGDDFRNAFDTEGIGTGSRLVPHYYYDGTLSEEAKQFVGEEGANSNEINSTRLEYTTEGLDNKQEIALTVPTIEPWNQSDDIHFGDAGGGRAVAWIRFGEANDADGKGVLVIDEIQSKRHQEGREKGYNNPMVIQILDRMNEIQKDLYSPYGVSEEVHAENKALQEELEAAFESENPQMKKVAEQIKEKEARLSELNREKAEKENDENVEILKLQDRQLETRNVREYDYYEQEINNIREAQERRDDEIDELRSSIRNLNEEYSHYYNSELRNARIGVIPAPFEKNWHELAMKRMLRYAAENGFDKVAWTTGAQQAERYNLGKYFSDIEREDNPSIEGRRFVLHGGNVEALHVDESGNVIESTIEEAIGKPLVDVVGKSMADRMMSMDNGDMIEGEDLRIGGEGMKGFYDKMLPSFVQKYTKKWGAKVGEVELPHLEEGAQKMWSVDVTHEMKESVMGGQTMFRILPNERLRKLDEGETCNVERVFTQQKMFNFSSGEKIESYEDVAYIFRNLEDEAVENAFVALVKNGKPTIVHLGMGTATQTTVDQQAVIVAIERINPDAVYFVHNHPSGNLKASRQDVLLLDSMKKAYGDIVKDGIIINLRSGKYAVFNEEGIKVEEASPNTPEKEIPAKTYSFSKRVFDKDFDVEELMHVTGSDAVDAYAREHGLVAALTSSQRLGNRDKLSLLVLNPGNRIVGNVFLNHTEVLPSNGGAIGKEIAYYVSAMGGHAGILYGRFDIKKTKHLGDAVIVASAGSVRMLDAISMTEFGGYVSALDEGVMEETPSYGKGETRFRVTDDIEEANARFNEELETLNEENSDSIILSLGRPSDILISAGVEDKPMKLYGNKVIKKMKKHGFSISELRNLPEAVADPIAVFDNLGREGNRSVLTELKTANGNFLVSLDLGKGEEIDFNIVSSVFGKGEDNIVDWFERGLSTYINKEKALNYLHHSALHAVALRSSRLDSAAKVIKDFQNPSVGGGIRFRSVDKLRDRYDKMVRLPNKIGSVKWYENLPYRLREAYQDSMLSLKILQDVILEETGNTMTSGENAYMAENQMSSKNKAEAEMYERDFFKPMMEEVKSLLAAGATYDEVQKYLFAKHGLERNMEMYKKNKQEAIDKWIEERTEQLVNGGMTEADARVQAQQDIALYPSMSDTELDKKYRRDYSGLTALTEKDNVADAEAEATQMVSDFEGRFDTAGLWGKINAATKETLRKSYDSGMMDKATYEKILGMYHYYIPLRGWDADVAEKEYEYLSDRSLNLSPVLVKTEGRTSLADDPIATIGFMAEGAIVQGNRNLMKQRFMNFVLNNPTSLVSVSKQWYVEQADGTWVPDNPQIPADATGDQVAAIVEQHEQKMLSLGKKAKTKRAGLKLDLHATKQEGQEHMVRVKRGGKEYCLYINGSPRAAQALNGMTNPDASNSDLYKAASAVKNFMARMFTSQNPAFVVSNLSRDLIWAGTAVAVRENKDYAARYTKNVGKAFKNATLPRLLHKYQNGTLDMNVEEERLFMEFIKHGGETGFTQITSVEDYKKDIKRFVKEVQKGKFIGKKVWDGFFDAVEFLNRSAEDTTRFMVYMTSRQMGRDVATSVSDAKEITVNFNKKGSGGLGASVMNFCYIFFNAAIQSLSGFGKMMAEHPKRTLAGLTAYASAGVIVPAMSIALQALTGDDDDESYWDLPEWIRRNNLVLYVPFTDSGFITIPLPHELRPFYAMGEIALSAMCGREDVEDGLRKVALNFAEMLPLDFTGNGGNLAVNLTPTIAQPAAQIIANKDYTGKPIYKDYEWNKRDPEWTKAYKGTSPWIVEGTKWLNRRSGGDDVKSGRWDWNPALIEHVLESYTGGAGKTFNRTMKTFQMMWDEDMRQWRNVPVISSFYQSGDERIQGSDVNNRYYEAKDEFEDTKHLLSGYKEKKKEHKPGTADYIEYARKLDELMNSDEYKRYKVFKGRQKAIKKVSDKLKETDDRNRIDSLNTRLMQLKEEMLEELEKADDSPKP